MKGLVKAVIEKPKDWKSKFKAANSNGTFQEDIMGALLIIAKNKNKEDENYKDAKKLVKARIANLESNLHIEIDMERIEDRSKALSYIGIEVAEALKGIPTPQGLQQTDLVATEARGVVGVENSEAVGADAEYYDETRVEVKPSLWQRIKNTKIVRIFGALMKIRIRVDIPALSDGSNNQ